MKLSIVLFNLGGPDSPEAVKPFLFNLFNDPAIIGLPGPLRWLVAKLISTRRAPVAREIYDHIGGASPLLDWTEQQAKALKDSLPEFDEVQVEIAMRYWHPRASETVERVKAFGPDRVVLLPLYPQFSTTTTGSSLKEWAEQAERAGLTAPTMTVCCYPDNEGFVEASRDLIEQALADAEGIGLRLLFSAHGLPKKVIDGGDPYQRQVERSVAAVVKALDRPGLDYLTCYQSRVGPLEWIGPSTEEALAQAAQEGKSVMVIPIAFVSEHSETLVELDIEYAELAKELGILEYHRVPTVRVHPAFIDGLAGLVRLAVNTPIEFNCAEPEGCPVEEARNG